MTEAGKPGAHIEAGSIAHAQGIANDPQALQAFIKDNPGFPDFVADEHPGLSPEMLQATSLVNAIETWQGLVQKKDLRPTGVAL